MLRLYGHFSSSASFRVRIALGLKGLAYETVPVHLRRGDQFDPAYRALNPDAVVPTLLDGDRAIVQSLAICEYLDETHPAPPLLPGDAADRAYIRAIALQIACEIHPLDNLRVLRYLKNELGVGDAARDAWYKHWIEQGLASVEAMLASGGRAGRFCFGDAPTLADVFLVPQIFNARRLDTRLDHVPRVLAVFGQCMASSAFADAAPERQLDAQ